MIGAMISGFSMISMAIIAAAMGLWLFVVASLAASIHFFILARHVYILREGLRQVGIPVGNL